MEIEVVLCRYPRNRILLSSHLLLALLCLIVPSLPNPGAFDQSLKHSELPCFWNFLAPFPYSPASLILVILKALYVFIDITLFTQNMKHLTVFLNTLFKAFFPCTLLHILHT